MERAPTDDRLPVQRNVILGLLLALASAAWVLLAWQGAGADMDMAMASPTMGMRAPLFLAIWVVMMVAMMFPTAAPMILTFHKVQVNKRQRGETFVATWVFVAAYLLVWTLSGVAAYAGALAAEAIAARVALSPATAARFGGAVLVVAGLYQITPFKDLCLSKCRTPISFIMTSWRDGVAGALRMGGLHGAYCLGCCWLLFVILFPLGIMNVAVMAVITLVIFAEKTLPWGRLVARLTAAALVAYGAVVLAAPQVLPTFVAGGGTGATAGAAAMDMQSMPMPRSTATPAKP
jgi:predicted metal-binding membrane protein